jgi:hypothetical protein
MELLNSQYHLSYYHNLYSSEKPDGEMNINDLLECIKFGYLKEDIEYLRSLEDDDYRDFKKRLPGVTVSGVFERRRDDALLTHSGLIQVDIDKVPGYSALFKKLSKDPFIYVCFRSPGGKGIKAIVKIFASAESHANQFRALSTYFKTKYKIEIDQNCKNVSRCMLLSYDPDIYCNPFSDRFEKSELPEIKPTGKVVKSRPMNYESTNNDINSVTLERILSEVKRTGVDLTSSYKEWIKIGFALCSTFGENGRSAFHIISSNHFEYDARKTDVLFSQLLKKNNGKATMASLVWMARENGLDV